MACFPFFIELTGKNCLVLGGGAVACRKAESLLDFAAKVHLISPKICQELWDLQEVYGENRLFLSKRECGTQDFKDVFLVIAATDDEECNRWAAKLCRERHILVNVADCRELCDFYFPSVMKREELVVGISSSGKSPLLAGKVRKKVEKAIPEYYGGINDQMGELRGRVQREISNTAARKKCLDEIVEQCEREKRKLSAEEIEEIIKNCK